MYYAYTSIHVHVHVGDINDSCMTCTPGHPNIADEDWHWLKCVVFFCFLIPDL